MSDIQIDLVLEIKITTYAHAGTHTFVSRLDANLAVIGQELIVYEQFSVENNCTNQQMSAFLPCMHLYIMTTHNQVHAV